MWKRIRQSLTSSLNRPSFLRNHSRRRQENQFPQIDAPLRNTGENMQTTDGASATNQASGGFTYNFTNYLGATNSADNGILITEENKQTILIQFEALVTELLTKNQIYLDTSNFNYQNALANMEKFLSSVPITNTEIIRHHAFFINKLQNQLFEKFNNPTSSEIRPSFDPSAIGTFKSVMCELNMPDDYDYGKPKTQFIDETNKNGYVDFLYKLLNEIITAMGERVTREGPLNPATLNIYTTKISSWIIDTVNRQSPQSIKHPVTHAPLSSSEIESAFRLIQEYFNANKHVGKTTEAIKEEIARIIQSKEGTYIH